jgi:hypothetical protein
MLFGTEKRLSLQPCNLEVKYRGHSINFTTSYKYLGYTLDSCLALGENCNIAYKKASNRVRLLYKLRVYVTPEAAFKIYEMTILPIITYSMSIKPTLTRTQLAKLSSIENRVKKLLDGKNIFLGWRN